MSKHKPYSRNPFAQFSASGGKANTNGGWMSSKKRGRDDDAIARDRQRALDARKKKKTTTTTKKTTTKKTTSTSGRNIRRKIRKSIDYDEESSDEDSMNDFVVDDDDEILEEEESSSSEEDELMSNYNKSRKKSKKNVSMNGPRQMRQRNKAVSYIEKYDDDEDDEDEDLADPTSPASNKTKKKDWSNFFEKKGSSNDTTKKSITRKRQQQNKSPPPKRNSTVVTLSSSEEESFQHDDESDDDDEDLDLDDDDDDDSSLEIVHEKKSTKTKASNKNNRVSSQKKKSRNNKSSAVSNKKSSNIDLSQFSAATTKGNNNKINLSQSSTTEDSELEARELLFPTKRKENDDDESSDDASSSSEEEETLLTNKSQRTSKKQTSIVMGGSIGAARKHKITNTNKNNTSKIQKKKNSIYDNESSSDDDDSIIAASSGLKKKKSATNNKLKKQSNSSEDDSENEGVFSPLRKKKKENDDSNRSRFFNHNAIHKKKRSTPIIDLDNNDDGDESEKERRELELAMKQSQESFEEEEEKKKKQSNREKQQIDRFSYNNPYDEDEEMALALAMSESQATYEKESQQPSKKPKKVKKKVVVEQKKKKKQIHSSSSSEGEGGGGGIQYLEDTSSEEEKADDDEDDEESVVIMETQDEKYQEAARVLRTANQLSREVLLNMISWSNNGNNNGAEQGMIVDGALAMKNAKGSSGDVSSSSNSNKRKNWISHEIIHELCAPCIKLADYQLIGVNWLALLHEMKVKIENTDTTSGRRGRQRNETNVNGILADVMGLGKTVQTIAFLAWLCSKKHNKKHNNKPHIIIVPSSVLDNWMNEFKKVAPQINVIKYHGPMNARKELRTDLIQRLSRQRTISVDEDNDVDNNNGSSIDVIVTTFTYFSGSKSDDRAFLRRFEFEYMVIDEAHCLKNPRSNAYQNLDKLKTSHRLLLTGTPVQNSPQELMSLICFLMPLFRTTGTSWEDMDDDDTNKNDGGARMLEYFVSIEANNNGESSSTNKKKMSDRDAYKKLKQLFAPFVLRRRKEDVLSQALPPKTREVIRVPLNLEIRAMYDSILHSHLQAKFGGGKRGRGGGSAADRTHLFTTLRKVANHPLLLRNRYLSEKEIDHLAKHLRLYGYFGNVSSETAVRMDLVKRELKKMSDFDIHHAALDVIGENPMRQKEMGRYVLQEKDLFCSPKLEHLRKLLPELIYEKGHRILIFSQWTNCLDLLGCLLESLRMDFFRLDGQTPIPERQSMINKFNVDTSIPVFLLSTKAGGMGINLTAADICILHDLDFNPFNDLQAEDRCHRIGQKKPVKVMKMVTDDTVDDAIYEMQQRKTKMNAAILEKDDAPKTSDNEEIKTMLQNQFDRFLYRKEENNKKKTNNDVIELD